MYIFEFPDALASNKYGYQFFARLASETIDLVNEEVQFNFSKTRYLEGDLCAILGSIIDGLQQRRNRVQFFQLDGRIQSLMQRNRFYSAITGVPGGADTFGSTIYYSRFGVSEEEQIKSYVEKELLNHRAMPITSVALKREIIIRVFEICDNAFTHGKSSFVYSCGQLYPRKNPPAINFTFVDLGKTIRNNVVEFLGLNLTGAQSIVWATSENNSTKTENHSGGIGLKLIKEFIAQNGGKFQIISSTGYWEFSQSGVITNELSYSFPGTIINLMFNISDKKNYYLASEIVETSNIF